jgi:hypothetical protein
MGMGEWDDARGGATAPSLIEQRSTELTVLKQRAATRRRDRRRDH